MIGINKTAFGIGAGIAVAVFIGYCIYFDNKRRIDPEYKKKVRERRLRSRKNGTTKPELPNHHLSIEGYYIHEAQLGEYLLERGDLDGAAEHLANAITVSENPALFLRVLQSSVPAQVFAMIVFKLQELGKRQESESNNSQNIIGTNERIADNSSNVLESSSDPTAIDELEIRC